MVARPPTVTVIRYPAAGFLRGEDLGRCGLRGASPDRPHLFTERAWSVCCHDYPRGRHRPSYGSAGAAALPVIARTASAAQSARACFIPIPFLTKEAGEWSATAPRRFLQPNQLLARGDRAGRHDTRLAAEGLDFRMNATSFGRFFSFFRPAHVNFFAATRHSCVVGRSRARFNCFVLWGPTRPPRAVATKDKVMDLRARPYRSVLLYSRVPATGRWKRRGTLPGRCHHLRSGGLPVAADE